MIKKRKKRKPKEEQSACI